ncbi:hypothetical protein 1 [Hubei sobemo-like virus 23]|uniref:hypothetical protein 1 n=1 Tax=Hubei sobemo-like virus 23 TaxID=1923209 RepID=UPI000909CCC7|nr:hypothetical protein 1 [Hubei sobemo-like virus 23]APG75797.1 hypothetical protein 1 [Hubei sobemo-like virus 23]
MFITEFVSKILSNIRNAIVPFVMAYILYYFMDRKEEYIDTYDAVIDSVRPKIVVQPSAEFDDFIDEFLSKAWTHIRRYVSLKGHRIWYLIVKVLLVVLTVYLLYKGIRKLFSFIKIKMYDFCGVKDFRGEAMKAGSSFGKGTVPDYQVEIHRSGTFMFSFSGYGLRYGDVLVVPTHVIGNSRDFKLVGKKTAYISLDFVASTLMNDVSYVRLGTDVWSALGTKSCKYIKPNYTPQVVTIVGKQGATSGILRKSECEFMMEYEGSTIPGMSGAAYFTQAGPLAMHSGVVLGRTNVGYTINAICMEVDTTFPPSVVGEGRIADANEDYEFSGRRKKAAWRESKVKSSWDNSSIKARLGFADVSDERIAELERFANADDAWTKDMKMDYNVKLNFEGENFDPSKKIFATDGHGKKVIILGTSDLNFSGFKPYSATASGQAPDEPQIRIGAVEPSLGDIVRDHERRIVALEAKIKSLQSKPPGYVCGHCAKPFDLEESLMQHVKSKHIKGESAYKDHFDDILNKDKKTFLEQKPSPTKNAPNSRSTSRSKEKKVPSTSREGNRS